MTSVEPSDHAAVRADMLVLATAACAATSPDPIAPTPAPPPPPYDQRVSELAAIRADLRARKDAGEDAAVVRDDARVALHAGLRELITPWLGTPWAFYGTTQTPGKGEIACGYFVSTLLRDAGLRVERVRMAQQAAEHILLSVTSEASVRRWRDRPVDEIVRAAEQAGEGTAIVGLDFHVGLLIHDGHHVRFCHSSWVDALGVTCEDPRTSEALPSRYTVPMLESGDRIRLGVLEVHRAGRDVAARLVSTRFVGLLDRHPMTSPKTEEPC